MTRGCINRLEDVPNWVGAWRSKVTVDPTPCALKRTWFGTLKVCQVNCRLRLISGIS
jgi:hypothetical protein